MNKNRKTSHILNVFQYDETTGAVTLPSTLVLTAPAGSDNSTKVPTTAWTRSYVSGLNYLTGNQTITVSGDISGSGTTSLNLTLANSGVTAGIYTKVTVDSKGRITVGASATTSDIAEGTNLYYTDARVLAYLGANNYATQSYVGTQIANLVASAPAALDTLNELAAALGNDASFATTTATALGNRLRIDVGTQGLTSTQQGYGRTNLGLGSLATLSSIGNGYITDLAYSKLTGVPSTFAPSAHTHVWTDITDRPTNLSSFTNGPGYITGITSGMVTTALGYTPYNSTNPSGYITGITSSMITTALGYTPYNSSNPNGYITGITSANVTTALGYTPYNSTNPSGYITSSANITGTSAGVSVSLSGTNATNVIYAAIADNDFARIRVGGDASNSGWMEIATADDGTEPIYVRQYTGVFSSVTRTATLLDGSGNTTFPGSVTASSFSGTIAWTNVSGRPTAVSSFTNDSGYITSSALSPYLLKSGGTMSGTLTLASISGTDQMVENTYGAYLHLGNWGVGRTATDAVLVNTAYRADYATDLFDMNISRFTNNSGYITSSGRAYPRRSDGNDLNFYWSGQSGQPTWLWGGNDGANMYVYNPSNFSVSYASSAGNADTVDSLHASSFSRKDTTSQWIKPYYEYSNYLTSETPANLRDQMGGGGLRVDFMHPSYAGGGSWNHVITWSGYQAYNMYQLGGYYDGGTSTNLYVRSEANHGNTSWTSWRRLLNTSSDPYAANMNQYVRTTDNVSFAQVSASNVYAGSDVRGNDVYTTGGWFRNHTNSNGIYWSSTGFHLYPKDGSDFYFRSGNSDISIQFMAGGGTSRNYIHNASDNAIGFLSTGRSWILRVENGGRLQAYGPIARNDHASGFLEGSYNNIGGNSTYTNPIYTIGSSYNPSNSSLNSMYGIGYSHPNFWGSGKVGGWGMYVCSAGTIDAIIGGDGSSTSIWAKTDIVAYSDARVKENVQVIENALEKVQAIRGVTFTRNDVKDKEKRSAGVIAQEVLAVMPEVVTGTEKDMYSVAYGNMAALFIEAIKEQQKQIEELTNKINLLIQNK